MSDYMKKPCKHCPFRSDVKPFLHPERAADLAYMSQNPYSSFPCHKTTVDLDDENGERGCDENTKECAGFLTLRARETDRGIPKGFEPSWDIVYEDAYQMADAYEEAWNEARA